LFVAAHDQGMADVLHKAKPTDVVKKNNERLIQQARKYVWGTNDSQLAFVRKRFAELPDREILTEEQKLEAVEAARGGRLKAA
jgi:hypothetical protein